MPGFDGSGPLGQGPMTGGGFGYCGAGRSPSYGLGGRGFGYGRGRRRGQIIGAGYDAYRPRRYYGPAAFVDSRTELVNLRREADDLKACLKDVEARMAELEKSAE